MKFIIYSPLYNENSGGILVLHKLCQILTLLGEDASIWYDCNPLKILSFRMLERKIRYIRNRIFYKDKFKTPYDLNIATAKDIKNSIIIYPEITVGNPLNASRVVRWLLYKPGKHTGVIDYGSNDFFFYYLKEFDDPVLNKSPDNQLWVVDFMSHIYKQINFDKRSGTCYMIRKGKGNRLNYHPRHAILLDEMSNHDIAAYFNKCEYFISYDLYTMFSTYAAVCGCIPIVVPQEGVKKEQWLRREESRYGIAYGYDDVSWAIQTREKLLQRILRMEEDGYESVRTFITKCRNYFNM